MYRNLQIKMFLKHQLNKRVFQEWNYFIFYNIIISDQNRIMIRSFLNEASDFPQSKTDLSQIQFFQSEGQIRASTAPSRPLTDIEQFKLSKKFLQLQQTVVCSNQLMHKSYDKFDLDSPEGQNICQKYLTHIQNLCKVYEAQTVNRDYRANFSQAYKVLYKEGQLSYLTQILDSAQQGFPYLWVNGQKYSFSPDVLDHGSRLMIEFFKLQHSLRDFYGKINQQPINTNIQQIVKEIRQNLIQFDQSWSTFQRLYVMELMDIQVEARSLISKAIQAEKCLTSVQIRQKMRGKILMNSEQYLATRAKLCEVICQINQIANYCGKGRDDLDHSILCQTEGILRRITKDQSKAIRILGQKIRGSFNNFRQLLKKYDKNIEMVDPQLKNNADLVQTLVQYQKSWEKGGNYFCDAQKKRHLLHFSGTIQGISQKYDKFRQMVECSDADIFLIIPCILTLKYLDKDDKNLCKYFLPNLNQIDTKTFRMYFELQKQFDQWKKINSEHYCYYNILQKIIIGVELTSKQNQKFQQNKQMIDKMMGKIKNIGMELHRYDPTEWNSFMEICLAGAIGE